MTSTFLNKAKVCIEGRILKDANDLEKDYQHFGPPLILAVDQVFRRSEELSNDLLHSSHFSVLEPHFDPMRVVG
ncbi:MAG: hypothetical protein ACXQT4_04390 [Methanotrichaceae archaeon]